MNKNAYIQAISYVKLATLAKNCVFHKESYCSSEQEYMSRHLKQTGNLVAYDLIFPGIIISHI